MLLAFATNLWADPPYKPESKDNVTIEKLQYHPDDKDRWLMLYQPKLKGANRPVVVFFHGGGWRAGTPKQFEPFSLVLARRGVACASVKYRLTGQAKWPACVEDCKTAVRFLRANSEKLGIDPKRVCVAGGSAGGHLAAMVALTPTKWNDGPWKEQSSAAELMILFNPAVDLRPKAGKNAHAAVQKLIGSQTPTADQCKEISPIAYITKNAPPCLMIQGLADTTTTPERAKQFLAVLKEAGVETDAFWAEGQRHGFFNYRKNAPDNFNRSMVKVEEFLKKHKFE